MTLVREPTNRVDPRAVKVIAPPLDQIERRLHYQLTRGPPHPQLVRNVAGQDIGRRLRLMFTFFIMTWHKCQNSFL